MSVNELIIHPTLKTPLVSFKPGGELIIQGRSIPEDGGLFFYTLFDWLEQYMLNPATNTVITIELEYHNDITSKYILKIIKDLIPVCENLSVRWIYETEDHDMLELGQMIGTVLGFRFEFIEKPE